MNRLYSWVLKERSLAHPQYLVMLLLWDSANSVSIKTRGLRVDLDTCTLSPLLKRMQILGIISRCRNKEDERSVDIHLTQSGRKLSNKAKDMPANLLNINGFTAEQLQSLKGQLDQ